MRSERRTTIVEVLLLLGVSLGASALWSILRIIERTTRNVALNQQSSQLNTSVTPDRPSLDLAYQLVGIGLGVVPALLALYLLRVRPGTAAPAPVEPSLGLARRAPLRDGADRRAPVRDGADRRAPARALLHGLGLAALIGLPGLLLYVVGRQLGITTEVQAANLSGAWWTVPVLVLSAVQNAVLEEVVVVGYLLTRLRQIGLHPWVAIAISAVLRGTYHLYQGFGPFLGNAVMGVVFGWYFTRTKRVLPLIVAHTVLDVVAFVGYTLAKGHLSWL